MRCLTWDGRAAGRIYRRSSAGDDALPWFWTILIIAATRSGLAETLDEAKAAFAENWRKWLASAGRRQGSQRRVCVTVTLVQCATPETPINPPLTWSRAVANG
jgi:hypothetical protein